MIQEETVGHSSKSVLKIPFEFTPSSKYYMSNAQYNEYKQQYCIIIIRLTKDLTIVMSMAKKEM